MRPSRDSVLLDVVDVISQRGTCSKWKVGAVVAREGRILTTGYNGAPSGLPHCSHACSCSSHGGTLEEKTKIKAAILAGQIGHWQDCATIGPCKTAVHAEANAVAYAARWGISLEGSTLYCRLTPCLPCAQLIINSGIGAVIANTWYRDPEPVKLLEAVGLRCTVLDHE